MGGGGAAAVAGVPGRVEGAVESGEVGQVGAVAGGEDQCVQPFRGAVGPCDLVVGEAREHRAPVGGAGGEGGAVAAVVQNRLGGRSPQQSAERGGVQAGASEPEVQVLAQQVLPGELHRRPRGQRRRAFVGELCSHLYRGVPRPDHDHALPGERCRAAVVGRVQDLPGKGRQARQVRAVRAAEAARGGDHRPRRQPPAALQIDREAGAGV